MLKWRISDISMPIHVEILDSEGQRFQSVEVDRFVVGTASDSDVRIAVSGVQGRVLEVRVDGGRLQVRAEPGLPFPVRSTRGDLGSRFEPMLDGDALNVGTAVVRLRVVEPEGVAGEALEIDPGALDVPGAPIASWFHEFMSVADHLEGLTDPGRMIQVSLEAIVAATEADRVHLRLLHDHAVEGRSAFFLARPADPSPFRVSDSLVQRVIDGGRVIHVPVAQADPVASQFTSVRREGISSTIVLPLRALGRSLGVLYADCVRDGGELSVEDLQRVAFIGRLLASSLGNHDLVSTLARSEVSDTVVAHPALRTASAACADMVERVKLYAPTDYTVLLRGETGSGKEVLARAIHDMSRRSDGPFVPVNCAAIPESLMESMLFGHEKGAFTGATQARPGHFEEAHGGTLFLDEIGDMAHDLQAKILRVLQDRVVTPVGSSRRKPVDVRILAATHQDLEQMVGERRFREDLYYRLRELEIRLPPLRRRPEDIGFLAEVFLGEAASELGYEATPELAGETLVALQSLPWRGNIRELRHMLKAAALRAGAGRAVRPGHLDMTGSQGIRDAAPPEEVSATPSPVLEDDAGVGTWKERLEAQEREALRRTLEEAKGNLTRGAALFGVPRTTYREKLAKVGLI